VAKSMVFVEFDGTNIIRIIRKHTEVYSLPPERVQQVAKSVAVGEIRRQVVARAGGQCEHCGKRLTPGVGEMNEKIPKGRGGEVSLDNCEFLCYPCHQGKNGVHGDRFWGGRQ
jgi:5-methylcytosine-specific restriction endonuclease McrA